MNSNTNRPLTALESHPDSRQTGKDWSRQCTGTEFHAYSVELCPKCGAKFCWCCCGGTNVHEGGKYAADFMLCPSCGHDVLRQ